MIVSSLKKIINYIWAGLSELMLKYFLFK